MKKIKLESIITVFESVDELSDVEKLLVNEAKNATSNSYAPYSKFHVGCSLLMDNHEIITGSNQENAVFPLGICAERVALSSAGNNMPNIKVKALAIAVKSKFYTSNDPVFPCGSCRHTILEFENRHQTDIKIYLIGGDDKVYLIDSVKDILPSGFNGDFLKTK